MSITSTVVFTARHQIGHYSMKIKGSDYCRNLFNCPKTEYQLKPVIFISSDLSAVIE